MHAFPETRGTARTGESTAVETTPMMPIMPGPMAAGTSSTSRRGYRSAQGTGASAEQSARSGADPGYAAQRRATARAQQPTREGSAAGRAAVCRQTKGDTSDQHEVRNLG